MSSREQQTSMETPVPSAEPDPEQFVCAQKRIEELEEKQQRQEMEIRRLEAALRKASLIHSPLHIDVKTVSDGASCSTKSVEEMTSGAPSSQLSPRTTSSASLGDFGLLASGIEGLAAAVAAAVQEPPLQQEKEFVQEKVSEDQSTPSSIPSTPEMPVRELPAMEMSGAANFFNQWQSLQSGTSCAEAADCSACSSSMPSYTHPSACATPPVLSDVAPPEQSSVHVWYRVAFCGGICVRSAPCVDAPRTGLTMPCNEVFAVSEVIQGPDRRKYLRLADGRGWVFDDSEIMPEDPAVVRGHWAPARAEQAHPAVGFQDMPPPPPMVLASQPATLSPPADQFDASIAAAAAPGDISVVTAPPCGQPGQQVFLPGSMGVGPAPVPPPHTFGLPPPLATPPPPLVQEPPQPQVQAPVVWYRVAFCGGISVRVGPDAEAPRTGTTLLCHEVFAVAESVLGPDQRVYLRLLDGRGWVFDDSMIMPEDPAVIRLDVQMPQAPCQQPQCAPAYCKQPVQGPPPGSWQVGPAGSVMMTPMQGAGKTYPDGTLRRWTRGKRGGVKKNRRRHQNAE